MTPGNNGASTPEDDDPFGYLYEDGQARGAQPPSGGGYGYPNSVNRVRAVGDRRPAAAPQQTAAYGQAPQGYGQPPQQYGQVPQQQGLQQAPPTQQPPRSAGRGSGGGRGPNTKGLLIGAVAVVLAVVVGITIAVSLGDKNKDKDADGGTTPAPGASSPANPSESESGSSPSAEGELPETTDAKAMKLEGTATTASDIKGSKSGTYVTGLNSQGASVTWTVNGIPADGDYTVFAMFNVVGEAQNMTLSVNGKPDGRPVNFGNFTGATDPTRAWSRTYSWTHLTKGTNTISISCQAGNKCNVLLDQMALRKGQVKSLD